MIHIDRGVDLVLDPVSKSKIPDTAPNWKEFEWLWKGKGEISKQKRVGIQ